MREVAAPPTSNWRQQSGVSNSSLQQELPLQYLFQNGIKVLPNGSESAAHKPNTSMTFGMLLVP